MNLKIGDKVKLIDALQKELTGYIFKIEDNSQMYGGYGLINEVVIAYSYYENQVGLFPRFGGGSAIEINSCDILILELEIVSLR